MRKKTSKFVKVVALTLMMAVLMSVTMPMVASAWSDPTPRNQLFQDSQNHWAAGVAQGRTNYIGWALANGITTGTSPTTFAPNSNVTRAQFVTFFHRVYGSPTVPSANFADMPANEAFQSAISWARYEDITTGIPAGGTTFRPNNNITREQMATMLFRHIGGAHPADALDGFTDRGQVNSWALYGMRWAAYHGIMGVNVTAIRPQGNATRAETVAMLYRVVDIFDIPTPPAPPPPATGELAQAMMGTWNNTWGSHRFTFNAGGTGYWGVAENPMRWWLIPGTYNLGICITPQLAICYPNCISPMLSEIRLENGNLQERVEFSTLWTTLIRG